MRQLRLFMLLSLALTLAAFGCEADKSAPTFNNIGQGEWVVSGSVFDSGGTALAGVRVDLLSADQTLTNLTDTTGTYRFLQVSNGDYNVKPTRASTTFAPAFRDITVNGADLAVADFVGTGGGTADAGSTDGGATDAGGTQDGASTDGGPFSAGYTVTGKVARFDVFQQKPRTDTGVVGVKITLSNATGSTHTYTRPGGTFQFIDRIPDGTYDLKAEKAGWTFVVGEASITVAGGGVGMKPADYFQAHSSFAPNGLTPKLTTVAGVLVAWVEDAQGEKMKDLKLVLVGDKTKEVNVVTADNASGLVTFAWAKFGKYRIYPATPGFSYAPTFYEFSFSEVDEPDGPSYKRLKKIMDATPNATATYFTYTLSGKVTDAAGAPLEGVSIQVASTGSPTQDIGYATTGSDGAWQLVDHVSYTQEAFVVIASKDGVAFDEPVVFAEPTAALITVPDLH